MLLRLGRHDSYHDLACSGFSMNSIHWFREIRTREQFLIDLKERVDFLKFQLICNCFPPASEAVLIKKFWITEVALKISFNLHPPNLSQTNRSLSFPQSPWSAMQLQGLPKRNTAWSCAKTLRYAHLGRTGRKPNVKSPSWHGQIVHNGDWWHQLS